MDLLIPALLCGLCLPLAGHAVVLPWLKQQRATTTRARHARHVKPAAADIAEARAVTAAEWACGNVMKLPCRECGLRQIPPVEVGESPWMPVELLTLVGAGSGWVVVATCSGCFGPTMSRKLGDEEAARALAMGVVDGVGATP